MTRAAKAKRNVAGRARRLRPEVPLFLLLLSGFWGATALVVLVDPLDLYPWGHAPRLLPDCGADATPFLVAAVARSLEHDTILVGGSTFQAVRAAELEAALPGARRAFNLSYRGPRPADRALVLSRIGDHSAARRVIVALDWIYVLPAHVAAESFPAFLLDADPWNDLRMVSLDGAELAVASIRGWPLRPPGWDLAPQEARWQESYDRFQAPSGWRSLASLVDRLRGEVDRPGQRTCRDYTAIHEQLVPFARRFSSRGKQLDIVIPPYSLACYFEWMADPARRAFFDGAPLSDLLQSRRCLVDAVEGLPAVRVFAFDNDDAITSNMANYRDSMHLQNREVMGFVLRSVGAGRHRLSRTNFEEYANLLRRRVKAFDCSESGRPGTKT